MEKPSFDVQPVQAFALPDLLATLAFVFIAALVLTPALARQQPAAREAQCQSNLRQLANGWMLYAIEHSGRVVNNYGIAETSATSSSGKFATWASQIQSWDASPDNTNTAYLRKSVMTSYTGGGVEVFWCPADIAVSAVQIAYRFPHRARSYSMNAFVGPMSPNTPTPNNTHYPTHRQWLRLEEFARPAQSFTFIEEHPDSINDGYFLNNPTAINPSTWGDVPSGTHQGAGGLTFADGHYEFRAWRSSSPRQLVRFIYDPSPLTPAGREDYQWLINRTAVLYAP